MRTLNILIILFLCLNFSLSAQNILGKKISVDFKEATLKQVVEDLNRKFSINFSYSPTILSEEKKVTLKAESKTVKEVLDRMFENTGVSYQQIGKQIVLKKSSINSKKVSKDLGNNKKDLENEELLWQGPRVDSITASTLKGFPASAPIINMEFTKPQLQTTNDQDSLRIYYLTEKKKIKQEYYSKMDSLNKQYSGEIADELKDKLKNVLGKLRDEMVAVKDTLKSFELRKFKKDSGPKKVDTTDTNDYLKRHFQVSFISPLGTNGLQSGRTVNNASLNIVGGYSAGLEGIEVGALANIEKDYVKGAQFAGFANIVKDELIGTQAAGFANINGGYAQGAQVAGFMNLIKDNSFAVQGAGYINIVTLDAMGGQFAGFANIVNGSMYGPQGAGYLNIVKGDIGGMQVAGFMNIAGGNMYGFQGAGFMNVATKNLNGLQAAGFINVAGKVKGSQIGLINIADSVSGAQVGFISIARKGYRKVELWGTKTMYGNVAFKTGTKHFHNIFAAGIRPSQNEMVWGVGYGFGSEFSLGKRAIMNLDLLSFQINEGVGWTNKLNLLNQAKINFGFLLTPKISVFAGPDFNIMVSQVYNSDTNSNGSSIKNWTVYDKTTNKTNVSMWPGFNAGIRF